MIRRIPSAIALAILCAGSLFAASLDASAAARSQKARPRPAAVQRDAAIVVDGATGQILYARNANEPRKPASLTKMMTLYLLFEELDRGNLTLSSQLTASRHASEQEPTKVGIVPGGKIDVETAIKALTVLSANDVAVVIAESIGTSEEDFARRMTERAHQLGMTTTHFLNASGLPNPLQVTSAHDMALLGRHLAYDYPQYFGYFSAPSFTYQGRTYLTHDHLLGAVDGVDGIKTGFTRASGFNLVTSAVRGSKHVVGVVMGGLSYASRDKEMVRLVSGVFDAARDMPALLADANPPWRGGKGPAEDPFALRPASQSVLAMLDLDPVPPAKRPSSAKGGGTTATGNPTRLAGVPAPRPKPAMTAAPTVLASEAAANPGVLPVQGPPPSSIQHLIAAQAAPQEQPNRRLLQGDITGFSTLIAAARTGLTFAANEWTVQIGAYANANAAEAQLASRAKGGNALLKKAKHIVEPIAAPDGSTLYRARFGGFRENDARAVCTSMIRKGQDCFPTLEGE